MIRWGDEELAAVEAALTRAAGGMPATLVIEGAAGLGKSTLLDTIGARAADFAWLATDALDTSAAQPFDLLTGLGIDTSPAHSGDLLTPVLAAQRLRARIDVLATAGPVLITIDDLQWADAESVETLLAVISRASGDRLLVCVGTRPLETGQHDAWQRWSSRPGRVERLELTGLTQDAAVEFAHEVRPALSREVAIRLWEHTAGNPLYLGALLAEYDGGDLAHMRELPAPLEFAQRVSDQVDRLPDAGRELAGALAVLGGGWWPVRDAAAVGALANPSAPVKALVSGGLAESRPSGAGDQIRFAHSLVRAAVYQRLPRDERQELHARAAVVVTGVGPALEHRLAAVDWQDDELATELEAHATTLHTQRSYRLAGHFQRLASAVSSEPLDRERRWLEAHIDAVLAGDRESVNAELTSIQECRETPLRDLVLAVLAQWERRPRDAVAILSTLSSATAAPVDQAWVQHRIEALLGWNLLTTGAAEAAISEALSRAEMYDEFDPTISRLGMLARAQVTARHAFGPDQVPGLDVLPDNPTAVPEQATSLLGWRGVVRANTGQFALAIADLAEMTERMQRGLADFSSGTYHAMLARAQWYAGDWTMARVNFRLAGELAGDLPPPLVLVSAALPAIGVGAADAADKALAVGQDAVDRSPWLEAVDQLFIVEVIRQHAVGAPDPSLHSRIKPALDQIRRSESFKSVVWCLHAGLAALWAKEPDDVALCAERVAGSAVRTEWAEAASAWLRGLALETTGDGKGALAALRIAISRDASAMPLYRAHFHVDHARVAHLMKDLAGAARSLDIAASTYHQLGATSYLNQVDEIRRTTESIRASSALALSDRERDVLALVTAGMSYAQIARDLFITQSTVSYHLGNIYAKANVTSRHQLTELAREDPSMFGLAAPA